MDYQSTAQEAGFSILELLVVMGLSALLLGIGALYVPEMQQTYNRLNAKGIVLQDIKFAQAYSITEGCRGIIQFAQGGASYTFGCDYLDYDTEEWPSYDRLQFTRFLPDNVTLDVDGPIIFNSRGQSVDVDFLLVNRTVGFWEGGSDRFATGTLLGTGVFTIDE